MICLNIKNFLFYGIRNWEFYKLELPNLTTQFQNMFYQYKQKEIKETIKCLLEEMAFLNGNEILDNLTSDSLKILKGYLANKYGKGGRRVQFSEEDLQRQSERVLSEYPVILSTTFSSTTSLGRDVIYDYLIIDEASQVDIATGALALSCAQNAVIVGDSKQLPHIVTKDVKQKSLQL